MLTSRRGQPWSTTLKHQRDPNWDRRSRRVGRLTTMPPYQLKNNIFLVWIFFIKMGHSWPLFVFSIQLTVKKIRTEDLWYRKQPLCQLSHNHCPTLKLLLKSNLFLHQLTIYCWKVSFLIMIFFSWRKCIEAVMKTTFSPFEIRLS